MRALPKIFSIGLTCLPLAVTGCPDVTQAPTDDGDGDDDDTGGDDGGLTTLPNATTTPADGSDGVDTDSTAGDPSGDTTMGVDPTTATTGDDGTTVAAETDSTAGEQTDSGTDGTTAGTTGGTDAGTETGDGTDEGTDTGGAELLPCADADIGNTVPHTENGTTDKTGDDFTPSKDCSAGNNEEIVLQWTAPEAGIYEMDTVGSDFDTILYVHEDCDSMTELACDDDITTAGMNFQSRFGVELEAGQTVLIVVDGFESTGNFVLNIDLFDPDSAAGTEGFGDCINALPDVACLEGEFCIGTAAGTEAVCGYACNEVADCPDLPAGGDASSVCNDVTGDALPECTIDCSGGETCPDQMSCFFELLCMWSE